MKALLTIIALNLTCLISIKAQEPTLLGTEQMFSRSQVGLVGAVRAVLTVDKRDMGGFAKTFNTIIDSYDVKGAAVDSLYHNADVEIHSGKLVRLDYSTYYIYDSRGKLVKRVLYNPNGSPSSRDEYVYDNSGRLIEINGYSGEKTLNEKSLITYAPEKRQSTVKWFTYYNKDREPSTTFFVYTFNDKGQTVERTTLNADGSLNHRIVYSYDDKGNLAKESHYDEKNIYGWGQLYTYTYDLKGNWVERVNMYTQPDREASMDMVTYRVITYYGQSN